MEDRRIVLAELNRRFYRSHGAAFGATRRSPWRCWETLGSAAIGAARANRLKVLDVGCGQGRYLRWLCRRVPDLRVEGTGVDFALPLLASAREGEGPVPRTRWVAAELDFWPLAAPGHFDLVVAWGLVHHLATESARGRLIAAMSESLRPGGVALVSAWAFDRPRFEAKRLETREVERRAGVELPDGLLEPADAFFGFAGLGDAVRYCRRLSREDLETLVGRSGFRRVASGEEEREPNRWVVAHKG